MAPFSASAAKQAPGIRSGAAGVFQLSASDHFFPLNSAQYSRRRAISRSNPRSRGW